MFDLITNDIGTLFNFSIFENNGITPVDLTNATSAYLYVKFPDGITIEKHPCTISATTNIINYISESGDFPISGTYILETQVFFGVQVFNSRSVTLRVGDSIIPSTPI